MWCSKSSFGLAVESRELSEQSDNEKLPTLSQVFILPVNKATSSLSCLIMQYADMILLDCCCITMQCRMSVLVNRHFLWKPLVENNWFFCLLFSVPFLLHQTFSCLSFPGLCWSLLAFHHLFLPYLPSLGQLLCIGHWPHAPLPSSGPYRCSTLFKNCSISHLSFILMFEFHFSSHPLVGNIY